jgi:transcription termination/antitermination protein NusG
MSQTPSEVTGRSYSGNQAAGTYNRRIEGTSASLSRTVAQSRPRQSPAHSEARWYAAYTKSRHEKTVAGQLQSKGIETFLPLYETLRRWKNGTHLVQLPLFPGYAFARFALAARLPVLKIPGVVRLVGFSGMPAAIEDDQVESLRQALANGVSAEPHPYLTEGRRVRITAGPLAGREGILVRRQGLVRVVLSIDLIQRSVLVDVNAESLEPA